ncbi:MAG: JAB domain-containing protein [Ignavibacteriaceae bacterium]|jgi:DNA repair protein RadC|nr:JAB domain-containing protein [Bacteroidota bacterium]MBX2975950.1 JAB domain-containing protein [Ignavibacteriaceae bacterium]
MMNDKIVRFKTLVWKFRETSFKYPDHSEIPKKKITSPKDFFELFQPLFKEEPSELFVVAWLSSSNRVVGFEKVTLGLLNSSLVDPRSVFRGAIIANCANIILSHNHPSGNVEASQEDISITKTLVEAGKIIGINIFDHIIFAEDKFTSFVERRLM